MDDGQRKEGDAPYKCHLCDTQFKTEKEKAVHKTSQLHSFMVGIKRAQQSYIGDAKTLNEQITETGKKEPLIGLEYVYEYAEDDYGGHMYECKLCELAFSSELIFFHIVGIQHRVLYLAKHHPIMGIEDNFEVHHFAHYRKLANNALAIEQTHGRKKINVLNEVYVSNPDIQEVSDTDTGPEDELDGKPIDKDTGNSRRDRRARARMRLREEAKARSRDDDDDARSRQRDRESRRDTGDVTRFSHDDIQDFDARTLSRAGNPGSQNNSKDDAKVQPAVSGAPPIAGGGPTSQDAFDDTDFRRRNVDRGGSSGGRDANRRGSSPARDAKNQNRRRNRSPDSRSRVQRPASRFGGRGGDIDVRSVLPSGGISFRELRNSHERKLRGGFSSAHLPLYDKKQEKETDSDMEVCSMEFSDCEPDDFWCNEELFDFLKSYYIGDEEGVKFILDAVKLMSEALVRHKSRKEDLQKRIFEERERLEEEKKQFQEMKKRKEDKITSTSMRSTEPENVKLFHQVTGNKKKRPAATAPVVQQIQAEVFQQQVTDAQAAAALVVQQACQKAQKKANQAPSLTNYQKALVSGIQPLVQQAIQRAQVAAKIQQTLQVTVSQNAVVSGVGPLLQHLFLKPSVSASANVPQQKPVFGSLTPLMAAPQLGNKPQGSETQTRVSRFDNPFPVTKQGQGAARQSAPTNLKQTQQQGVQKAQGSETRFNQNKGIPASRNDNPDPQKDTSDRAEHGADRYEAPDSSFTQNEPFPGSWSDDSGSLGKTKPPLHAGSETRFTQNPQIPASRFDNPSKEARPMIGQGGGGYPGSDSRYNQSAQYPGSWSDSSGSLEKTKPPLGAGLDAKYKQMQWSSGPQSGNQGFYNEPRAAGGMEAGRYGGEQYNQNQWQSQITSREAYGPGMDRPQASQGSQPMASSGFPSDRRPGAWPSQDPPKSGTYPASILKNRTGP